MKFIKNNWPLFAILAVSLIVYHAWILNLGILTRGDWTFFFNETMETVRIHYFSTWLNDRLGRALLDASQAPTYTAYGFLAKYFNISYALSERIIHMWPIIIFGSLGSYLLLNNLFKRKIAVFIGMMVFMFNTYMLIYETGHLTLAVAISLSPLVMFMFIEFMKRRSIAWLFSAVLIAYVQSSYEIRGFYIMCIILFSYLIFFTLTKEKNRVKTFLFGIYFFVLVGIMNLFWILPLFVTREIADNFLFSRNLFGGQFTNLLYTSTLYHSFWTGLKPTTFNPQQIIWYFWIIPVVSFLGLYLNRKNLNILFFGIIALLGIFLTKQVASPFGELYPFLFKNLPGFSAFRESSKFFFLISLGYSVLIASFVNWIWEYWNDTITKRITTIFISCLLTLIFLWNTKPLITGEAGTLFVTREIPNDYLIVKDFIVKQPEYFRTLWVPRTANWSVYTSNHPALSLISMVDTDWRVFSAKFRENNSLITDSEVMTKFMQLNESNSLLNLSSVKYVLVLLEDKANDNDTFVHYGGERQAYYIEELDKIPYLKKIDIGTEDLIIYENDKFMPHFYITSILPSINNSEGIQVLSHYLETKSINPSQYQISIKNLKEEIYLNFSEKYNSNWKLRMGEFSWLGALFNSNYFLPNDRHFKNDAYLNSFYINPQEACVDYEGCIANEDGSYNIELTLFFLPQAYMYLGGIISILTLVSIASSLVYLGIVSVSKGKKI